MVRFGASKYTLFTSLSGYKSKAKEAAIASKPLTQIQKTDPATDEKLKAFLTSQALDETKADFLPPRLTPSTRNEDMSEVLDKKSGKILAIAPVAP